MPNIHDILSEIKSPQWVITTLSSLVAAFGAIGILNTNLTGPLQGVLAAILAVLVAVGHKTLSDRLMRRTSARLARRAAPIDD